MEKIVIYRRLNMLCVRCGKELDRKGIYCTDCNEISNIVRKRQVNMAHTQGLCTGCKKPLDREGWFCTKCNEQLKKWGKQRIHKRKAAGICTQCGKEPAVDGRVRCQLCLDKNRISSEKYRNKKKRSVAIHERDIKER